MELKIWVEGIPRVVCGVTESTTCQDVVIALAHATGKTGRFSLLEKWRESERLIAPTECPLRVLHKWGEYANDVHFVLRHSDGKSRRDSTGKDGDKFLHDFTPHLVNRPPSVKRNLTFSGAHSYNSYPLSAKTARKVAPAEDASVAESPSPECSSPISASSRSSCSPSASRTSPRKMRATASVSPYSSLERKKLGQPTRSGSPYYHSPKDSSVVSSQGRTYSTQSVPLFTVQSQQGGQQDTKESNKDQTDGVDQSGEKAAGSDDVSKGDLVKLVNLQIERLDVQRSQMKMIDAEIGFWEHREQEQDKQDQSIKEKFEQLMATEYEIDNELEELEIVSWVDKLEMERHHHQRLVSELSVLRGKVSDVEQAIAQQHTETASLSRQLEEEEKAATKKEQELKEQEIRVLQEISELQKQINTNLVQHEKNQTSIDGLQNDVKHMESAILEKKTQIAGLEKDLKEANMDDFVQTPTTWLITPSEGSGFCRSASSRPGSARRMTQSPQRLKEVTPTARNPQGLWV